MKSWNVEWKRTIENDEADIVLVTSVPTFTHHHIACADASPRKRTVSELDAHVTRGLREDAIDICVAHTMRCGHDERIADDRAAAEIATRHDAHDGIFARFVVAAQRPFVIKMRFAIEHRAIGCVERLRCGHDGKPCLIRARFEKERENGNVKKTPHVLFYAGVAEFFP